MFLRASSSASFMAGPFIDDADGKTPKTGLTIAQANVRLSKAGAAFSQKSDANNATSAESGFYIVALNSADLSTPGRLVVRVSAASCLPVWHTFDVLPGQVHDSIAGGSDLLDVNISQWADTTTSAPLLEDEDVGRLLKTTIASVSSQIGFTLTSGATVDDAYLNNTIVIFSDANVPSTRYVQDYTGATRKVSLDASAAFSVSAGQTIRIFAQTHPEPFGGGITSVSVSAIVAGAISNYDVASSADVSAILASYDVATSAGVSAAVSAVGISSADIAAIASAVHTQVMDESYAADGSEASLAQAVYAIHQTLQQFAISGVNYTVKKLDGSTTAFVLTLDDSANPSSLNRT